MKKILASVLAAVMTLSVVTTSVSAQQLPSGTASESIGAEIESFYEENAMKCASVGTAVFVGDEVVYSRNFGFIDENDTPATADTVYEWGSISKLFVWVSAMQLYEQGKLDLNADIRTYLPEGFFSKLKYDDPITMLNLMNHNAGWQETVYGLEVADEADIIPLGEALQACEPSQINRPGEVTSYSNWGAALAGYVVECVSGQDYVEYVHENILQPLGMEHTSVGADYRDNEWVRAQREKLESYYLGGTQEQPLVPMGQMMSYIQLYPAGSVTGTIADLASFAQAFVDDECLLFDKPETLDEMLSASSLYSDGKTSRNCHGMWTEMYAVTACGHGGNTQACSANLMFDPVSKTGVVVATNNMGEGTFCYGIPEIVLGNAKDNPALAGSEITERNDISGYYVSARGIFKGFARLISYLSLFGATPTENEDVYDVLGLATLTRIADDTYLFDDGTQKLIMFGSTASDGRTIMQMSGADYVLDNTLMLNFCWIILMVAIAVLYLVILTVKLIVRLAKKKKYDEVVKTATIGQVAMVASILIAAVYLLFFPLGKVSMAIVCIAIMLCALVMLVASVMLCKDVFTVKDMKKFARFRHIITVLVLLLTIAFIICFQLYNFWS